MPKAKSNKSTTLSNTQKRFLKSKAHPLKAVVIVAGNGLTENVLAAIEETLNHHELIKGKIKADSREDKAAVAEKILKTTKSQKIQLIGHVLTLYRQSDPAKIILPR